MTRLSSLPLVLLALLVSTACQTTNSHQLESIPATIKQGVSTKADVQNLLGEPDRRQIDPSGETWHYGAVQGGDSGTGTLDQAVGIGAGFIPVPYVGTAINGLRSVDRSSRSSQPSAAIKFDSAGVVKDYVVEIP